MPRKQSYSHSHSPHPSRHTSPHSRHTSPHSRHTSPHSRHTSPHSRHTSPHSRHTSPHSRHTSPHSRHTSPHSRHTSPHSRHTSPHGHGHSHGHSHSHSSPHQNSHHHHDHHDHHDVHDQHPTNDTESVEQPFVRNSVLRASVRSTASHVHAHHHSHHHHRRRKRVVHAHSSNSGAIANGEDVNGPTLRTNDAAGRSESHPGHQVHTCARRHRSVTDLSNTSLNTCNDPTCTDREVQEIFVHKSTACCSGSRPELAQYFAEDLYGSSSRRPSSCCTSSDYCYQTDSTSLYGSRSSLSRNNSLKSASVTLRKKKISQQRQPSYHSISLRALNDSRPHSQTGSLASIFDRAKHFAENGERLHGSSSKVTIERHTSKDALSNDLPEYACSPSPIRWSFLADGKASTDSTVTTQRSMAHKSGSKSQESIQKRETRQSQPEEKPQLRQQPRKPQRAHKPLPPTPGEQSENTHRSRSNLRKSRPSDDKPSTSHKCCESPCKYEESTVVQFHHVAETFNNCCSNYIQCNTYLDQDLQITSEDIHQYLSKGQQDSGCILNNTKTYPFQPSNALEFQYKNNFANNNTATNTLSSVEGAESMHSYDSRFRRNSSKETNLNQNTSTENCAGAAACTAASCRSTPLSPTNINLSSSTNNINIVFSSSTERNANEVKFINTTSRHSAAVVTSEAHHSSFLPYSYPTYDYTNMSANSIFDKPLGIDEIPRDLLRGDDLAGTTSSSQHSSSLHSPEPRGVSFESFDASSGHNLLASSSQRGSCQFSPTTPRSPISPDSPTASSTYSASVNPSTTSYVHLQPHHHPHYDYPPGIQRSLVHAHTHSHHHHVHDHLLRDSFKISSALKKVRKRARKYTDFLRKK